MRFLSLIVLLFSVALYAAACGSLKSEQKPKFELWLGPGVEAVHERFVRDTLESVRDFYTRQSGRDLQSDVLVRVYFWEYPVFSSGSADVITLNLSREDWDLGDTSWWSSVIAHEVFHAFQFGHIGRTGSMPVNLEASYTPAWIYEGSAELAAYAYMDEMGLLEYEEMLYWMAWYTAQEDIPALTTDPTERWDMDTEDYDNSFVAVDELVGREGIKTLIDFFEATSTTDWQIAFNEVFGIRVQDFIRAFEANKRSRVDTEVME